MLDKPVSSDHPKSGFYSRLFQVHKKSGGWRPVIDLSRLNRHVITPHFKMETLDSVRLSLRKHDWAISLDLTDAYFHIPIHPKSRRYLRFHFMGKTYKFRAIAFGLAPAPYVFSRIVKAVVKHALPSELHVVTCYYVSVHVMTDDAEYTSIYRLLRVI